MQCREYSRGNLSITISNPVDLLWFRPCPPNTSNSNFSLSFFTSYYYSLNDLDTCHANNSGLLQASLYRVVVSRSLTFVRADYLGGWWRCCSWWRLAANLHVKSIRLSKTVICIITVMNKLYISIRSPTSRQPPHQQSASTAISNWVSDWLGPISRWYPLGDNICHQTAMKFSIYSGDMFRGISGDSQNYGT